MSHVSERELQPGQVIADRYRLEAPIGRGAMGAVWRAVHVRLQSPVAIKFLNASIAGDRDMLERFMREARSAAAVRSSHVVQIFDYGVDGGVAYIAMELLVGEPLDERLAARGSLAPPELDKVFAEVARAVGVAHELGVVHRDIKPANIFIAREGGHEVTKVLDFGIAKLIDRRLDAPAGRGTHTGIILGTPNYMSPEQARGHRTVDHRADLWSLAVLAFECLTGRQPFESEAIGELVVAICTAQPLLPSQIAPVPAAFDAWFLRGVDKDPEARFASASEMAEALHGLLAAEGLGAESRPRSTPSCLDRAVLDGVQLDGVASLALPSPGPGSAPALFGIAGPPSGAALAPSELDVASHRIDSASPSARAAAAGALARGRAHAGRIVLAAVALPSFALGVALVAFAARPARDEAPPSAAAANPGVSVAVLPSAVSPSAVSPSAVSPSAVSPSASVALPSARAPVATAAAASAPLEPARAASTASDPASASAPASLEPAATGSPRVDRKSRRSSRITASAQRPRKSLTVAPSSSGAASVAEVPRPSSPLIDPYADRL